ncbi:KTSC domain-containing protein [Hymenobacter crusticola]|uniref:KTSC domain-containing protein n=1 Tax=Hymenobacter crusticola TaxID=1770526 RepID=A0A243WB59_9BACT|nr:KTSC domain-containing protein [Hymenobacter crusticola]OUJ72222.1 hypothetical protein BXP70_19785 [Hymenobacter crusticola]
MKRQLVRSTSLKAVGYDATAQLLEIEYRNGRLIRYVGVAEPVYQALVALPGKALFVEQVLEKNNYEREQVR